MLDNNDISNQLQLIFNRDHMHLYLALFFFFINNIEVIKLRVISSIVIPTVTQYGIETPSPWLRPTSSRSLRPSVPDDVTSSRSVSKQCSGKSHVDDSDWSEVHNLRQNKAGIRLLDSPVRHCSLQIGADMSSPPKEKVETKGGHLPAGNAPWACVVFESFL